MSLSIEYLLSKATFTQIEDHLLNCEANFLPPLSDRVEINDYAQKIMNKATRFEAWSDDTLIGLLAVYCDNQDKRIAYITNVSVLLAWTNMGIAARLVNQCIEFVTNSGMRQICLEVNKESSHAIKLYESSGFVTSKTDTPLLTMNLFLDNGK